MKKQERRKPTRGGLTPVRVDNLTYKTGLTVAMVCKEIRIFPKVKPSAQGDAIVVMYEKHILDEDGQVVTVIPLSYSLKDTGELIEFEAYQKDVFADEEITNINNSVVYDDDGDVLAITTESGVDVDPIHLAGDIIEDTVTVLDPASEPLADWTAAIGNLITNAVINQMKIRNGY